MSARSSRAAWRVDVDASANDASGLEACLFLLHPEAVGEGDCKVNGPGAVGEGEVKGAIAVGEDEASGACGDWLMATSSGLLEGPRSLNSSSSWLWTISSLCTGSYESKKRKCLISITSI